MSIDAALSAETRAALIEAISTPRLELSLADVVKLNKRLSLLKGDIKPVNVAFLRTYTTELLAPYLTLEASKYDLELIPYHGLYNNIIQELQPDSALFAHDPKIIFLQMQWSDLAPELNRPWEIESADELNALSEQCHASFIATLQAIRSATDSLIVATLLPSMHSPGLGQFDSMATNSERWFRETTKRCIANTINEGISSVVFCDFDSVLAEIGRHDFFDLRLWHTSRFPFTEKGAQAVAQTLVSYAVMSTLQPIKCIVLDADNTLWGGIVGEDGVDGIAIGDEYPGSVFRDFQRRLLTFTQRGIILALCSKNNESDVMAVLDNHPHQLIRREHLAAHRINWEAKPQNIQELAQELNLGLESLLFVDDSPHECLAVRQFLPDVTVVQVPDSILDLPYCLDRHLRLERLKITVEDKRRTELYKQESERKVFASKALSLVDYLKSLEMKMTIGIDDRRHISRIAQLTQKTNQFNLTTKRYSEADIESFILAGDALVAHFSLTDRFGASGLVGIAILTGLSDECAEFDSFLISCRVIGRQAEFAFASALLEHLSRRNVQRVRATYAPTAKNALAAEYWRKLGLKEIAPNNFELDLNDWSQKQEFPMDVSIDTPKSPAQTS